MPGRQGIRAERSAPPRAVAAGRVADDIKILPSASFVLGDTEAEAVEKYHAVRNEQVTGQTVLILLEQIWNRWCRCCRTAACCARR